MSIESLINKGFVSINIDIIESFPKQVIVLGVARGGTSIVAGALSALGMPSGEQCVKPVFEDVKLANLFEIGDFDAARKIVDDYDKKYDRWFFKRPSSINYLNELDSMLENPLYICVFKDVFSVANRNSISMGSEIINGMSFAIEGYSKIINFLKAKNKPILFLSAEKVISYKTEFIQELIQVIGLDEMKRGIAEDFIQKNPAEYLDQTRNTKVKGRVVAKNKSLISGYAYFIHRKDVVVKVELHVGGKLVALKEANILRLNRFENGEHPSGKCGFEFNMSDYDIRPLDQVRLKVEGDNNWLPDDVSHN